MNDLPKRPSLEKLVDALNAAAHHDSHAKRRVKDGEYDLIDIVRDDKRFVPSFDTIKLYDFLSEVFAAEAPSRGDILRLEQEKLFLANTVKDLQRELAAAKAEITELKEDIETVWSDGFASGQASPQNGRQIWNGWSSRVAKPCSPQSASKTLSPPTVLGTMQPRT